MAIDGDVSGVELDKFDEIGNEIDSEFSMTTKIQS